MNSGSSLLVHEGATDGSALNVLSGRVAIRRRDPDSGIASRSPSSAERRRLVRLHGSRVSRAPRPVVALETATCVVLEQMNFDELLTDRSAAWKAILATVPERLDHANRHARIDRVNSSPISFVNNRLSVDV